MVLTACGSKKESTQESSTQVSTTPATSDVAETDEQSTTALESEITGKVIFVTSRTDMDDKFKEMTEKFHEKYPNAEVEIQSVSDWSTSSKIRIAAGDVPDIFQYDQTIVTYDILADTLLPLDDMGYTEDTIEFYNAPAGSVDGKHYGLSEGVMATGVLASKKTLESIGVTEYPKTLDEFYAICDKLKENGITPLGSMVKSSWPLSSWFTALYAYLDGTSYEDFIKNQVITSDTPITKDNTYGKAYQFVRNLFDKGYFDEDLLSSDWDVLRKQMDKVGMLMLANYGIGALEGLNPEDIAFFPLPVDNSGTPVTQYSSSWYIGINKDVENPETAKAFLKFYLEEAGYQDAVGILPSVNSMTSSNAAIQGFLDSNPKVYYSTLLDPTVSETYNNLKNQAQFKFENIFQDVLVNKDDDLQPIFDKYNKMWANARKSLGE
jgi:ABC-type glycerol-3-phosphate transport system substrate-binding protein